MDEKRHAQISIREMAEEGPGEQSGHETSGDGKSTKVEKEEEGKKPSLSNYVVSVQTITHRGGKF
jgi:hypothetical protein